MKLDFEIAVDQKTKDHDRTFEGVPDSGCPPVPAGQPRPFLVNFWLNFAMLWGAQLVATNLLNTQIFFIFIIKIG